MNSDLFQLALSYHQAGALDSAERIYQQILENDPYDSNVLHLYGILSAQKGNHQQSLELITRAIEIDPQSPTFHNSMGNVLWLFEKFDEAIRHYEISIDLQPNSPTAHNNLANLYSKRESYEKAIAHYQSAIKLKPDYAEAYYNLAMVLVKMGRENEAIDHLQKAIAVQPDFFDAQQQLAIVLHQTGELDSALPHYLELLEKSPNPQTFVNVGAIYVKQGDLLKGIDYFNKALELEPDHYEAHYNLGSTYLSLEKPDEALKYYFRCLQHHPDADVYYNIATIYMFRDRHTDAIDHFNSALKLRPHYFEALVNLGATYLRLENYEKAIDYYKQALEIQPENEEVEYILNALSPPNIPPSQAPLNFVKHLFDQYAPYFEKHLQYLNYQGHLLLYQEVNELLKHKSDLAIVDLGCGTGLCGALFKPMARKLIGVDISAKMVEIAQKKNIYDELIVDDLTSALLKLNNIDLVLAADVFGYLGDLENVFEAVHHSLSKTGYFAFTVEQSQSESYSLEKSTRFGHSKNYIHELCRKNSFKLLKEDEIQLRMQRKIPVPGYLFILQKT